MPKPRQWEHCHWVTTSQVCEYLGVCSKTVGRMVARGEITRFKRGSVIRFQRREIDDWMAAGGPRLKQRKVG